MFGGVGSTVTATVTSAITEVIYTNVPDLACMPGYIEVCVNAGDSFVPAGPWTFTVTTATGAPAMEIGSQGNPIGPVNVLTGQCSGDLPLLPGQYTITESFSSPDYVSAIAAFPAGDLLGWNLAKGTGTFAEAGGAATTAFFTNDTLSG